MRGTGVARMVRKAGTVLLNFANPRKPGGGFMEGVLGQEEVIAHTTTLLPTLEKHTET